jgi:ATP-dependent DNA helicase DinG
MRADERLCAAVITELRHAIAEAHDQEVLVVGRQGEDGSILDMVVAARGNEEAVPALMPYMSRGDLVIHNHQIGRAHV